MTFDEYLKLTDEQRNDVVSKWNPYAGEGSGIVMAAAERLRQQFSLDEGVKVDHGGVYHGGDWTIAVGTPFIFDRRRMPKSFLGISVRGGPMEFPPEFQVKDRKNEYIWAPERYEAFVDRATDEIREKLKDPNMSRAEMLNALSGRNFEEFKEDCRQWEREGKIPPYRKPEP